MKLRKLVSQLAQWMENLAVPGILRFKILFPLYAFMLAPTAFVREILVVTRGQRRYYSSSSSRHSALLRRNVHRLEKGLTMQPRADVFAEDYIVETVDAYLSARSRRDSDQAELEWSRDVLATYFSVTANSDSRPVANARARFERAAAGGGRLPLAIPSPRASFRSSTIQYEDFLALCMQRKSVRWFLQNPVPRGEVEKALQAALQAPSACNRQPFYFRYLGDQPQASRIAGLAMGTAGYAHQIPALVVVLGDFSCFPSVRDRHVPYIDASLAAMQFMLALETVGLASCAINWPDIGARERRMRNALNLSDHLRPIMLIALGYADPNGGVPFSAKKPISSVLVSDENQYH